jgi:hypothetical protein
MEKPIHTKSIRDVDQKPPADPPSPNCLEWATDMKTHPEILAMRIETQAEIVKHWKNQAEIWPPNDPVPQSIINRMSLETTKLVLLLAEKAVHHE